MSGEKFTVALQLQDCSLESIRNISAYWIKALPIIDLFNSFNFYQKMYWKVGPGNIALLIIILQEVVERRNIFPKLYKK